MSLIMQFNMGAVAASAEYITPPVDLEGRAGTKNLYVGAIGLHSSGHQIWPEWSDDGVEWFMGPNIIGQHLAVSNWAGTTVPFPCVRFGRYLRIRGRNGTTAQTNLRIRVMGFDNY
jgi:hypothetical protein